MSEITVAIRDFTTLPGARYKSDGTGSAQEFFEDYISPQLTNESMIIKIDFDGTWGYASSFLSELALRLVQSFESLEEMRARIRLKSDDEPGLLDRFWEYVDESLAEES